MNKKTLETQEITIIKECRTERKSITKHNNNNKCRKTDKKDMKQ